MKRREYCPTPEILALVEKRRRLMSEPPEKRRSTHYHDNYCEDFGYDQEDKEGAVAVVAAVVEPIIVVDTRSEAEKRMAELDKFRENMLQVCEKKRACLAKRESATTPQQLALNRAYNEQVAFETIVSTDTLLTILSYVAVGDMVRLSQTSSYHARLVPRKVAELRPTRVFCAEIGTLTSLLCRHHQYSPLLAAIRATVKGIGFAPRHNPWATPEEQRVYSERVCAKWCRSGYHHLNPPGLAVFTIDVIDENDVEFFIGIVPLANTHLEIVFSNVSKWTPILAVLRRATRPIASYAIVLRDHGCTPVTLADTRPSK